MNRKRDLKIATMRKVMRTDKVIELNKIEGIETLSETEFNNLINQYLETENSLEYNTESNKIVKIEKEIDNTVCERIFYNIYVA